MRVPLTLLVVVSAAVWMAACGTGRGTVTGIVVDVAGDLEEVTAFTVDSGGVEYRFVPASDGTFDFPLPHLRDHMRTAERVRVDYREVPGGLEATAVADG